ncbi:MAG: hypothetical protein PVJ25_08725, partial [Desulfuromonadales bacterium]
MRFGDFTAQKAYLNFNQNRQFVYCQFWFYVLGFGFRTKSKDYRLKQTRTGGLRPARRLTFVHAATKVSKNAFLLAEGISFAGFPRLLKPAVMRIRPCVKGPDLSV